MDASTIGRNSSVNIFKVLVTGASAYRMELHQMIPENTGPTRLDSKYSAYEPEMKSVEFVFSVGGLSTAEEDQDREQKCILDSTKQLAHCSEPCSIFNEEDLKATAGSSYSKCSMQTVS
jgi:hypothetical protein